MTGSSFPEGSSASALVVGGDSLVGGALRAHCRAAGSRVEATTRRAGIAEEGALHLDLSDPDFSWLATARPAVAFVCAAVTSMQACQADPAGTRRINVDNTVELMRRLADRGAHLVFLSSSQVFDGETALPDEESATAPLNVYGAQKLAVEQAIAREGLPAAILRVTKVLADRPVGVFKGWSETLVRGQPVSAASNMALSPVMVSDVAAAAEQLAAGRHCGVWHLGARDEIGYLDAARLMAAGMAAPLSLVRGEALTEEQVPAIYRPRHVTLACGKIERSLGMSLRGARDVLDALFAHFPRPAAVAAGRSGAA